MSANVWSALADRFVALAAEQDFDLRLYSLENPSYPPGIAEQSMRFRAAVPGIQTHTGFTGLALFGSPKLTGEEFLRLNRFLWLAWVAGRLLCASEARPELEWFLAVHQQNPAPHEQADSASRVRQLVAASAVTARSFAVGGSGGSAPAVADSLPASWQEPLLSLRGAFWEHASAHFDFALELHGYTNPRAYGRGKHLSDIEKQRAQAGRATNHQTSEELIYWADSELGSIYTALAQRAGRQLPEPFITSIRLLPAGIMPIRPTPLLAWSEFLWLANPQNYQLSGDFSDIGSRKAIWCGGNPFMASALAIDQFVKNYGPATLAHLNRRAVEVCAWFDPLDRSAALAAIEAAFRSPLPTPLTGATSNAVSNETQVATPTQQERKLTERKKLILTEMLAMGAVGSTKKTTRNEVVQRIDTKKTGADFARDFSALKGAHYTGSDAGPDGGVWLTGKGKTKAEELNKENGQ